MKKEEYLKHMTEQIRCEKARGGIAKEIGSHIEEQKTAYMSEGMEPEEAEEEAVRDMGDPVEAGAALDMLHRPQMAWGWISLIAVLYVVGFIVQIMMQKEATPYLENQTLQYAVRLVAGFGVMVGICYVDYSRIGMWAKEISLLAFGILYVGILFFGTNVNGATLWIYGIHANVRMLIFLFVPLYGAILYQYRGQGYRAVVKGILWMLPALIFELRIPSIITMWILFLSFIIILSTAIGKGWFQVARKKTVAALWIGTILMPVLGCALILSQGASYQADRIRALLNPASAGYTYHQTTVIRELIAGSHLVGAGENTQQMIHMLPDAVNYSLIYVIVSYGILAAVFLAGIIVYLFLNFLGKALKQKNQLGMIMGIGCSVVMLVQMVFYILENIGYTPLGLTYCPFITYGGTGMVITNILLGLLLSIYRYQDIPLETDRQRYRLFVGVKKSG